MADIRQISMHRAEQQGYWEQVRFYQSAFEQLPVGLAIIDRVSGRICWKNRLFTNLFGSDDLTAWAVLFPSEQQRLEQLSALDSGRDACCETTRSFIDIHGRQRWLKTRLSACAHTGDRKLCYLLTAEDISDYKRNEDELTFLKSHDELTRLHNRSYFQLAKKQLDHASHLPLSCITCEINGLELINETMGYASGDHLLLTTAAILIGFCRKSDVLARTGGYKFSLLLPKTDRQAAISLLNQISIAAQEKAQSTASAHGFLCLSLSYATKETAADSLDSVIKEAENQLVRQKLFEAKNLHNALLTSIQATLYQKSHETKEHGERMSRMARSLGRSLALSERQLQDLELLASLHDIGKICIDAAILNKPGKLSDEEWKEMKKHPETGYRFAQAMPDIRHIADSILYHHERWDGQGYPQGLFGKQIPLYSRILAVIDAFDAMTNDRAYRKAMCCADAICEIRRNAGSQFDPVIADVFIRQLQKAEAVSSACGDRKASQANDTGMLLPVRQNSC